MNDSAIQSTPASSAASRSAMSFGASAASGTTVSGRLTPLRFDTLPPTSTRVTIRSGATAVALSRSLPSSMSSVSPSLIAANISGCGSCTRLASPDAALASSVKSCPLSILADPSLNVPTRNFGPCRSTRTPIGRLCSLSTARIMATNSRMRSGLVWLILMRNTSAPAVNSRLIVTRSEEAGPSVATTLVRRCPGCRAGAPWRRCNRRRSDCGRKRAGIAAHRPGRRRALLRLFARFRQLHGPGALFTGIDFEEPGAVITARQAVADALDREFLVTGAHKSLTHPFAAAIVIYGVDIIITGHEIALQYGFAGSRRQVPPALGGPAIGVFVTDGNADPARRVVA